MNDEVLQSATLLGILGRHRPMTVGWMQIAALGEHGARWAA
jgi:hypothetical protein